MTLFERRRASAVSFLLELIMLVAASGLIGWYFLNKEILWERTIAQDTRLEEITVHNYGQLRAAFANPSIKTVYIYEGGSSDTLPDLVKEGDPSPLLLSRDLHLFGGGRTLDAHALGRLIEVLPGGALTLQDLSLVNAAVVSDENASGGAILIHPGGSAFFERCNFENNSVISRAGAAQGGASYGDAEFHLCNFINNQANGTEARGGAVAGGRYTQCEFRDNTALSTQEGGRTLGGAAYGGAFNDSLFSGNSSLSEGDAFGGGAAQGQYTNCLFLSNTAESKKKNAYGGGVCEVTAMNTTFSGNQALAGAKSSVQGGGSWKGAYTNCTFIENRAFAKGGSPKKVSSATLKKALSEDRYLVSSDLTASSADLLPVASFNVQGGGSYAGSFTNCILVGNSAQEDDVFGRDVAAGISFGGNVIGDAVLSRFESGLNDIVNATISDVFGNNRLEQNGGYVKTIALIPGSPAERRGVNSPAVPPKDARGIARSTLFSDSGAYERSSELLGQLPSVIETNPAAPSSQNPLQEKPVSIPQNNRYEWQQGVPIESVRLVNIPEALLPNSAQQEGQGPLWDRAVGGIKGLFGLGRKMDGFSFDVQNLPQGLIFNPQNGELSGTPLQPGEGSFTVNTLKGDSLESSQEHYFRIVAGK